VTAFRLARPRRSLGQEFELNLLTRIKILGSDHSHSILFKLQYTFQNLVVHFSKQNQNKITSNSIEIEKKSIEIEKKNSIEIEKKIQLKLKKIKILSALKLIWMQQKLLIVVLF